MTYEKGDKEVKSDVKLVTIDRENDDKTEIVPNDHTLSANSGNESDGNQRHLLPTISLPKKLPFSKYYRNKSKFKSPDKDDKPEIYRIFERIKNKRNEKLKTAKVPDTETSSTEIKPSDPDSSGNPKYLYYGCRPKLKSAPKHIFGVTKRPENPDNSNVVDIETINDLNYDIPLERNENSKVSQISEKSQIFQWV